MSYELNTEQILEQAVKTIKENIVAPTIEVMSKDGNPFLGVLYPGLILTENGPKILEYNARFGDPETQTYMRLLETDIVDIFDACIDGNLDKIEIKWKRGFACTIVLASGGYPENYEKGKVISGIDSPLEEYPKGGVDKIHPPRLSATPQEGNDVVIFHAGTKAVGENFVTNGGRVLGISATGDTLQEALAKAYKAIEKISFEGMQYRRDIGQSALKISIYPS